MNVIKVFLLTTVASITSISQAENQLIVVSDQGGSSALPYYKTLNIQDNSRSLKKIPAVKIHPITAMDTLPIVSNKLSPGKVETKVINANGLIRPFFMIGDDDLSVTWLKQRAPALEKLQAVGLVVNVKSSSNFNNLQKLVPSLMILPTSGDDIADRLGLSHYPVLVTATAIEQ